MFMIISIHLFQAMVLFRLSEAMFASRRCMALM